jgi:hypothetical protein
MGFLRDRSYAKPATKIAGFSWELGASEIKSTGASKHTPSGINRRAFGVSPPLNESTQTGQRTRGWNQIPRAEVLI